MPVVYILPSELKVGMMLSECHAWEGEGDYHRTFYVIVSIGKKFITLCRKGNPHSTFKKAIPTPREDSEMFIPEVRGRIDIWED